jgi:outer membrane protein OmpA-like peptidoglycan-associated protein/tetratricopeptide (TPR) repeat protein
MRNNLYTLILTLFIGFSSSAQSFKSLYYESLNYLEVYDFESALPVLEKMYQLHPDNANTCFTIGNCLMNIPHREKEAIPYYEKAMESLTVSYRMANPKEKKAPLDVIELLGNAYHMNYEFDKAIEKFEFFGNFILENNWEDKNLNKRKIRQSKYALELIQNPVNIKVNALDNLNTQHPEYRPLINAEENIIYFTSRRPGGSSEVKDDQENYYEDIYYSEKINNKWTKPSLALGELNIEKSSSALYLSADGEYMFTSMVNTDAKLGPVGRGIFESFHNGFNWSKPKFLENNVNSKYWETTANLDLYQNILLFVSDREGGYGGRDIWMVKKLPNGNWTKPQNLGEPINTEYDEESPYLHPDGKTLYFSSVGHKSMGGFDIFKSTLNKDLTWSAPVNIGYPINTVSDDLFFTPTVSGNNALFSSYRDEGKGDYDIYELSLLNEEESHLSVYKGIVKCQNETIIKDLTISVINEKSFSNYDNYHPNDSTGHFVFVLQSGHNYNIEFKIDELVAYDTIRVPEDEKGIQEYTKIVQISEEEISISDGVEVGKDIIDNQDLSNLSENNQSTLQGFEPQKKSNIETGFKTSVSFDLKKPVDETKEIDSVEKHILFYDNIHFKSESSDITNHEKTKLDKLITELKNNPNWTINSIGHTDSKGSIRYNQILSTLRSESVKTYICNRGINYKRVHTVGKGETVPIAENVAADGSDNPTGSAANRRVEIQIIK